MIKKAFCNFNVNKLSKFNKQEVEKIMNSKGMIRNIGKIEAIIENSKKCKGLQKKHGSVLKWIEKLKKDYKKDTLFNPSLEESFMEFRRIGKITSGWIASLHNSKGKYLEYEME